MFPLGFPPFFRRCRRQHFCFLPLFPSSLRALEERKRPPPHLLPRVSRREMIEERDLGAFAVSVFREQQLGEDEEEEEEEEKKDDKTRSRERGPSIDRAHRLFAALPFVAVLLSNAESRM